LTRQADAIDACGRSKLTREQINRLDHCISQMDQAWNDRFVLTSPKFLKRYLRGEVCLHLHLRMGASELNAKQFCAVLASPNHMVGPCFGDEFSELVIGYLSWSDMKPVRDGHGASNDDKQTVFVGNGELIENGERVVSRFGFPVRLQSFDDCARSWGDAVYYSTLHVSFETAFRHANRELVVVRGLSTRVVDNQCMNKVVKAGSQVVNDLPSNHGKCKSRLDTKGFKDILRSIRVEMSNDAVVVNRKILLEIGIEIVDVLFGPINLRPTSVEWMGGDRAGIVHGISPMTNDSGDQRRDETLLLGCDLARSRSRRGITPLCNPDSTQPPIVPMATNVNYTTKR
jgi:hypothetical protein